MNNDDNKKILKDTYKNMTRAKKYFRDKSTNTDLDVHFEDNELSDIITYHPFYDTEIKAHGEIEYFVYQKDPIYKQPRLYVKLSQLDSVMCISLSDCIDHLYDKYDTKKVQYNNIISAFRTSISMTKRQEKFFLFTIMNDEGKYVGYCEECQAKDVPIQVDHYPITFQQILDEFILDLECMPNECFKLIKIAKGDNDGITFILEDEALMERWVSYHDEIAEFRPLCKECNVKNGSYDYKSRLSYK